VKRYVLLPLLLLHLHLALPAYAAGSVQKPQRKTWYERALNHINPENKDFGAAWEERKRALVIQLGNPYFQYGVCVTGALILLLTIAVAQYTSHRRALFVAAQSLADVLRHDHYSREVANEAIRRYNAHIESCNQAIESGAATASTPDSAMMSELNRMNAVLLATRNESKALREDSEKKSRLIAELSVQLKKGKTPPAQIALDFAPSDYVARINELEMQLAAEKEKNQRQKGTPVDAHRA
jgi:hypothetical protein